MDRNALGVQNRTFPAEARSSAYCICCRTDAAVNPGQEDCAWGKQEDLASAAASVDKSFSLFELLSLYITVGLWKGLEFQEAL